MKKILVLSITIILLVGFVVLWGESDQTVNFDLVESAGDCGDPVEPAAGEDENTGLSCTISADEEIDLKINSVTNTPTWVSICFTGNWVD